MMLMYDIKLRQGRTTIKIKKTKKGGKYER
jgi:hypothetical protein